MFRAYQHLLYGLYAWQTRVWKTGGEFNAIILTSVFIFANTLTLIALFEALCGRALLPPLSRTQIVLVFAFLIGAQYIPLFTFGRYQRIIKRFHSESAHQRQVRGFILIVYALLSYASLICVIVFRGHRLHIPTV